MSVTAPEPTGQTTPAQRLDTAEQQAQQQIDTILAAAMAAGITGAALLAALPALTAAILNPAQAALGVGAAIALSGGTRRGSGRLEEVPLPTPIDTDVEQLLLDAAARLDAADAKQKELERIKRRLHRLAVTKIHQAASAGTLMYARFLGLGLRWVTRMDGRACPTCRAMHGRRVPPGERFANPHGPGIPRRIWPGFHGLPPIHPNCRCRPVPART
ncbi:hypothetical protein GCM10023224_05220 [Streptomonospora halophila]|uniref:Phage head morphogenesis domain-containing protein n=1 Tax=Streptomonospora halophila TaxID=427369 RepID=A0ABP9G566_9ACTN